SRRRVCLFYFPFIVTCTRALFPLFPTRRSSDLSDSSALQTRYLSMSPLGRKEIFLPWEKPAPPRPRTPEASSSSSTSAGSSVSRSEEHTSELQSPDHLVCRLLLEKKKTVLTNTK